MKWPTFFFGKKTKVKSRDEDITFLLRGGQVHLDNGVKKAWTSGNLDKMLKATSIKTNLIDRHYLLLTIIDKTYKLRKERKYRDICIKHADIHLNEFTEIAQALKEDTAGHLPYVSTFKHYAILLTEDGNYRKAVSVCEKAIEYGFGDGTKSGFEGRILRIKSRLE